jgi:hypothetical protein
MTIGFRAHKGGVDQPGVPNNLYTQITFGSVAFDTGPCFCVGRGVWSPPPGLVSLSSQVWIDAGAGGANAFCVAKIVKNGTVDVTAGIGIACDQPGTAVVGFACIDRCRPGDAYELHLYASAFDPDIGCTINGNPAHTWWCGVLLA